MITSRTKAGITRYLLSLVEDASNFRLSINGTKTKYFTSSRCPPVLENLNIDGEEFEAVGEFKYLGSTITAMKPSFGTARR